MQGRSWADRTEETSDAEDGGTAGARAEGGGSVSAQELTAEETSDAQGVVTAGVRGTGGDGGARAVLQAALRAVRRLARE